MEDTSTLPTPESPTPDDVFSALLRDILRTIDARIDRKVLKSVEEAMAEFKIRGGPPENLDERIQTAVQAEIDERDYPSEDRVSEMITEALDNCSVEFRT